jgi:hypothetical protein
VKAPGFAISARTRTSRLSFLLPVALWCGHSSIASEPRPLPQFERAVIDDNFPGAYQVEVADVNGDGKPDVVALGGGTCAWYENPTWKKRIVTNPKQTPGIISSATADLDGDGKAEIAIAYEFSMNQPTKGKLLLAHPGKGFDDPWTLVEVADVGSIHRLRWMKNELSLPTSRSDSPGSKKQGEPELRVRKWTNLVVAPLFGPSATPPVFAEEPAHLVLFTVQPPRDEEPSRSTDPGQTDGGPRGKGGGLGGGGGIGGGRVQSDSDKVNNPFGDQARGDRTPPTTGTNEGSGGGTQTSNGLDRKPRLQKSREEIGKAPVLHAIDVVDLYGDPMAAGVKLPVVLGASNLGVTMYSAPAMTSGVLLRSHQALVSGAPGEAPKKGASEIHVGRLKDGRKFLATVEPWHGTDVAVYLTEHPGPPKFGSRNVIDTTLKEGHALWVADVDGDGDDEVFAGYRGKGTSLIGYDFDGKTWTRTVIDTAIAAQDLRGGDIDGDGTPDFVGVGGSTHNVVWYRPKKD